MPTEAETNRLGERTGDYALAQISAGPRQLLDLCV
jgi:hypothetical protein